MAKFIGAIGFAEQKEVAPDVYEDVITERKYVGNITRNTVRWNEGSNINDEMRLDHAISIVADPYLSTHIASIRYITWEGSKWKVTSNQINRPRIVLQIGAQYHGA
jgi:hypothetical protein